METKRNMVLWGANGGGRRDAAGCGMVCICRQTTVDRRHLTWLPELSTGWTSMPSVCLCHCLHQHLCGFLLFRRFEDRHRTSSLNPRPEPTPTSNITTSHLSPRPLGTLHSTQPRSLSPPFLPPVHHKSKNTRKSATCLLTPAASASAYLLCLDCLLSSCRTGKSPAAYVFFFSRPARPVSVPRAPC